MDELARQLESAREHVSVKWSEERAQAVQRRLPRRRRHARRGIALGLALAAGACAFALFVVWPRPDHRLHFADGSTASPLDERTRLVNELVTARRVVVSLESGRARFSVIHDAERAFAVKVGAITVEDRGTEFVVEELGARARVTVETGAVRVTWRDGEAELTAGGSGVFPPEAPAAPPVIAPAEPHVEKEPPHRKVTRKWKVLAEEGDFEGAYRELERAPHDEPEDLLATADVARLSHHPAEAVELLRRLLRAHAHDPRAPLAAFTLGRVLLEDLGRPAEAAEAFVTVEKLAPDGPLVPDALAREVEAWSHAGEGAQAHARAEEYVKRFPTGSRLRSVRRYGGLD